MENENERPSMDTDKATSLFNKYYSLGEVVRVDELKAHSDRNFRFVVKLKPTNTKCKVGSIQQLNSTDAGVDKTVAQDEIFLMKITSDLDEDRLMKQFKLMKFISMSGFICPQPQPTLDGRLVCWEPLSRDEYDDAVETCLVYLLSYLHGIPVLDFFNPSAIPDYTLLDLGRILGDWRNVMKQYDELTYEAESWRLNNTEFFRERLSLMQNLENAGLVREILHAFEKEIPHMEDVFEKGMTHGDFHDENIILLDLPADKPESNIDYKSKYGIIDFSDTSHAPFIYDLATSVVFFMIAAGDGDFLNAGAAFVTGYVQKHALPPSEVSCLYVCVCLAYVRELVVGETDFIMQQENNEYLKVSCKYGWKQVKEIWTMNRENFLHELGLL